MSCNRGDLCHLIGQLQGWFEMKTMFTEAEKAPKTVPNLSAKVNTTNANITKLAGLRCMWGWNIDS